MMFGEAQRNGLRADISHNGLRCFQIKAARQICAQ